jgi:hypothetical protein
MKDAESCLWNKFGLPFAQVHRAEEKFIFAGNKIINLDPLFWFQITQYPAILTDSPMPPEIDIGNFYF